MDSYVRITNVAKRFGITTRTATKWVNRGYFPGSKKLNPFVKNSPFYVPVEEIEKFEEKQVLEHCEHPSSDKSSATTLEK